MALWTMRVDSDDTHEDVYVVHEALSAADRDHGVTIYLADEGGNAGIMKQTIRLIDWLNHIASDGVLPELPDDDGTR